MEEQGLDEEEIVANDVVNFFPASNMSILNKMGPLVAKVLLKPEDIFVLPWGYIICEKSINEEINSGISWLEVYDKSSIVSRPSVKRCSQVTTRK